MAEAEDTAGTEIVVPGEGGEVTEFSGDELREMEELARETRSAVDLQQDVQLPALVLVQKTHDNLPDDVRPGQVMHSLTQESFPTAQVVLVKMMTTRTYWGEKEGLGGSPPACSSPNALDGWGDPSDEDLERDDPEHVSQNRDPEPYGQRLGEKGPNGGGSCRACPKNRFGKNSCQLQYQYLGVLVGPDGEDGPRDISTELPVGFMMKRTSIKKAKQLNSLLLNMKFPWSNVVELSGEKEVNSRSQEYFIWSVRKSRPATMAEMRKAAEVAGMVRSVVESGGTVSVQGEGDARDPSDAATEAGAKGDDIPF